MSHFLKTFCWSTITIFLLVTIVDYTNTTKKYEVTINHPGEKEPVNIIVNQVINKDGLPIQYYMDVPSVICLEQVCKIIPVTLYWNNLGEFQKYELEVGSTLEKYKADLFEPQDYKKLQHILSDKNSPFKEVYYDEILTVPTEDDVDAVSGATALQLDEEDTVPGAALGCYTLWHWANGNIVEEIQQITGKSLSKKQLQQFLSSDETTSFLVGLKGISLQKNYEASFVDILLKRVLKDDSVIKQSIVYLENANKEVYINSLKRLFFNGKKAQRLGVVTSLKSYKSNINSNYFDELSTQLSTLKSYQEINAFLNLLQNKDISSKVISDSVSKLMLNNSNFIIARRAYWFLKKQELTQAQQEELNQFYKKYKNKL